MAGLFYLPRLFVYHSEQAQGMESTEQIFEMMEQKLLHFIMNPAMIATWILGLVMTFTPTIVNWSATWPWVKLIGILGMTWFHYWLAQRRKVFLAGKNTMTGYQLRVLNEVPTLLMTLIVLSVVIKF